MKKSTLSLAFALSVSAFAGQAQAQTQKWYDTASGRGSVAVARAIHEKGYIKITVVNSAPVAFDSLEAEFSNGAKLRSVKRIGSNMPLLAVSPSAGEGSKLVKLTAWREGRKEEFTGGPLAEIIYAEEY